MVETNFSFLSYFKEKRIFLEKKYKSNMTLSHFLLKLMFVFFFLTSLSHFAKLFFVIMKIYYFYLLRPYPKASLTVANLHETKASGKEIAITCMYTSLWCLHVADTVEGVFAGFSTPCGVGYNILSGFFYT